MNWRKAQTAIVDTALTIFGLALLGLGFWAGLHENLGLAGTALGAGLILLFAATIHRFESLKGLGMEAKTRELKESIGKAEVAVDQLRELAEFTGVNLLRVVSAAGRYDPGSGMDNAYKVSRDVLKILNSLNSKSTTIRPALEYWARFAAIDLINIKWRKLQQYFTVRREMLGRDAAKAHGEQSAALMRHGAELQTYEFTALRGLAACPLPHFPARLRKLLDDAPHLLPEQRAALEPEFSEAARQLEHLVQHLDYGDPAYWSHISRERG
jgi:hypothetical protein